MWVIDCTKQFLVVCFKENMWPSVQWVEQLSLTLAEHLMQLLILAAFLKQTPNL